MSFSHRNRNFIDMTPSIILVTTEGEAAMKKPELGRCMDYAKCESIFPNKKYTI